MSVISTRMLDGVRWVHLALTVLAVLATGVLFDFTLALGVLVGAVLALANFESLRWLGKKVMVAPRRSRGFYAVLFLAKMTLLFAIIWGVLKAAWASPLAFAVGFSLLLVAIAVISFRQALEPAPATATGGSQ